MNADTRREIIEAAHAREVELIDTKGREYTGGAEQGNDLDTLANFKRVAERTGLNALQVWGVYFLKHVDAISTYLQDPTRAMSEPITGRIDDARTYLGLLECLLVDLDPVQERNEKPAYQLLVKAKPLSDEEADRLREQWRRKFDGSIDDIVTESCRRSIERLAERHGIEARTPRRCGTCGDPVVGTGGVQMRTNDRTTHYCNDECARHGERRIG